MGDTSDKVHFPFTLTKVAIETAARLSGDARTGAPLYLSCASSQSST